MTWDIYVVEVANCHTGEVAVISIISHHPVQAQVDVQSWLFRSLDWRSSTSQPGILAHEYGIMEEAA